MDGGEFVSQAAVAFPFVRRMKMASSLLVFALLLALWGGSGRAAESNGEIVVASYNVENYLGEELPEQAGHRRARAKSDKAIGAVVRVVKDMHPDILGVCEMGAPEQFEEFKARLKEADLVFSDFEYVAGPDPYRHLALLSRFPIVVRHSLPDVSYDLNGVPEKVKRGFLDVTIRINPHYDLRLVGVHLKSKLAADGGEALMRRHEAELLRRHIDEILSADPAVHLLVYGDFNDTHGQPAMQEIMGTRGGAGYLADLPAKDSVGDRWTQYWKPEDLYSRIDYFLANPALLHEVVREKTYVYRSDYWNEASDHRPICTSILPEKSKR